MSNKILATAAALTLSFFVFGSNEMPSLTTDNLSEIFDNKESDTFNSDYFGRDISANGVLISLFDSGKDLMWFIIQIDEKNIFSCPISKENSSIYADFKKSDAVTVNGKISSAGTWAHNKDVLSLYLQEGCKISRAPTQ